ncbi:hypothetical protein GCM10027589_38820 [Actinocorallia lasiicapitis]
MRRVFVAALVAFAVMVMPLSAPAFADPDPVFTEIRVSLDAEPATVTASANTTFSGTVEGLSGEGWIPVSGQAVTLWTSQDALSSTQYGTSGADGRYAISFAVPHHAGTMNLRAEVFRPPFNIVYAYREATVLAAPTPPPPPKPDPRLDLSASIKMDAWGTITAHGRAHRFAANGRQPTGKFDLQFSPDGKRGWKTVKSVRGASGYSVLYQVKGFFHGLSGYWRWSFKGDGFFPAAVSPVVKTWRWATYFTGWKVAPKKVRFHSKITISGRLWEYYASGKKRGFARQNVRLLFTCKKTGGGKKWFSDYGWVKTDSKGRFSKRVKAVCTGKVVAVYNGREARFGSETKLVNLSVSGSKYRTR